jgi:hypothetical protein
MMLWRISGLKRKVVTRGWRKPHNEEPHNLYNYHRSEHYPLSFYLKYVLETGICPHLQGEANRLVPIDRANPE